MQEPKSILLKEDAKNGKIKVKKDENFKIILKGNITKDVIDN